MQMPKNGHLNENSDAVWFYPWEGGGGSVWPVKGAGCFGGSRALLSPLYLARHHASHMSQCSFCLFPGANVFIGAGGMLNGDGQKVNKKLLLNAFFFEKYFVEERLNKMFALVGGERQE